jgi:glycosyltransferase involved in cell wall biosynthesis
MTSRIPVAGISEECAEFWMTACPQYDAPPLATIVIPVFNGAATLARALASASNQSASNLEVIVVDDASTDSSWAIALEWLAKDRRFRAIRLKKNCGKSIAMNCAVGIAQGRWIAVLDADDSYHPERMGALTTLGESRGADVVADNQFLYDLIAEAVLGPAWPEDTANWDLSFEDFLLGCDAYETFNFGMLKPVVRSAFIRSNALAYDERARHGQDFLYLLKSFLLAGRAVITNTAYYYYTQPFGALSRQWSHTSRRRYDFQGACDLNRNYLFTAAADATPLQRHYLWDRCCKLQILEHYHSAKELLPAQWLAAVAYAVKHPSLFEYAAHRLRSRWRGVENESIVARLVEKARAAVETPRSGQPIAVAGALWPAPLNQVKPGDL